MTERCLLLVDDALVRLAGGTNRRLRLLPGRYNRLLLLLRAYGRRSLMLLLLLLLMLLQVELELRLEQGLLLLLLKLGELFVLLLLLLLLQMGIQEHLVVGSHAACGRVVLVDHLLRDLWLLL